LRGFFIDRSFDEGRNHSVKSQNPMNSLGMKKQKFDFGSLKVLLFLLAFFYLVLFGIPDLAGIIQSNFMKDPASADLIPEPYSIHATGILLFFFLVDLYALIKMFRHPVSTLQHLRMAFLGMLRKKNIAGFLATAVSLPVLLFLPLYAFPALFFNYSELYNDEIVYHNGFTLTQKTYRYSDIQKVKVSFYRGLYIRQEIYEATFSDGRAINFGGYGFSKCFYVEDRVPPDAVRTCTRTAFRKIIPRYSEKVRRYFEAHFEVSGL
jgi:hypothetical protein